MFYAETISERKAERISANFMQLCAVIDSQSSVRFIAVFAMALVR